MKEKELLEKLEVSENLIKSLRSEVMALKDELNQVKSLNIDLESQNFLSRVVDKGKGY